MTENDQQLFKDFQSDRNINSFREIMNRYEKKVFNFCLRYFGNKEDAEDAAQEIFIKVYTKADTFKWRSKFSTWLYSVSVNTCSNYRRKIGTRGKKEMPMRTDYNIDQECGGPDIEDPSLDPERLLINKELGELIRKSIQNLKKNQKSVIILKDFMGKSQDEIAEIMNMRVGTVKSTLSRGRLSIANQLKEYYKK